ncbi:MFS transporter [Clostridium gasigenes]|uniref:MFS transporter n=2 Tax=Clostridium gasigenes TaxID=94869 RepID=A0A7X0SAG2_9CLOT|nr:MFS transporter [Clostridium gasigenes]
MTKMKKKKNSILPLFLTVFIDLLGLGIVIPILPMVLLDPSTGILPMDMSFSTRSIIYGFLIAAYPIAQFFSAPILGALADEKGRKKILTLSLIGTLVGYLLFGLGILQKNVYLLFLGRILDGFTGGNISIAQSSIADISTEKTKAKNFGLIGMAFGLGFVIGPYMGGKLSDPSIVSWFNYDTPFWFAAILTFLNIISVIFKFKETLITSRKANISFTIGAKNIKKAFSIPNLKSVFLTVFFLTIGFNFFTQFFQVFLIGKFSFNQSQVGNLFAYMGIWIAFAQGGFQRPLSKKYRPSQILNYSAILLAIVLPMLLLPTKSIWIYAIIPFIAIFQGLTQPNGTAIVSNQSDASTQGEILGVNQSVQSLAQAIPPIIAGFVTSIDLRLPIILGSVSILIGWLIFKALYKEKPLPTNTESNLDYIND